MRINWTVLCAAGIALALCINPAYSDTQTSSQESAPAAPPHHHHHKHRASKAATHKTSHHHGRKHHSNVSSVVSPDGKLQLISSSALVIDQQAGSTVYEKNSDTPRPIASITKLMTAMVVLDAHQSMNDMLTISDADIDRLRNSSSRLRPGTTLSRRELLQLSLMSSENRATSALSRYYPGGKPACVVAMNKKASLLGMRSSRFADPTGLDGHNMATAEDLARMVKAADNYALIKQITTTPSYLVDAAHRAPMEFRNTNALVKNQDSNDWRIGLSKTGFINEAGHCLVMQAQIVNRPMIIVLLHAEGKYSGFGDANRIKKWLETTSYGHNNAHHASLVTANANY
jgi:serine-type D-Ala-D-Ala endopeptidase (penicillin-binding protein 7)